MVVQHKEIDNKGIFFITVEGEVAAELVYGKPNHNQMIIEHTEVSEALEGKGAGKELVYSAVNYARLNNIKVIPLCPFAKALFDRKAELRDVLL